MKRAAALFLMAVLLLPIACLGESIDLTVMTKSELEQLRQQIDAELKVNHTTTYNEEKSILGLTEQYVEPLPFRGPGSITRIQRIGISIPSKPASITERKTAGTTLTSIPSFMVKMERTACIT